MDGFRDRAYDALRKAAGPALERIRKDGKTEGLPAQVGKLLGYLEDHLFDPALNVTRWRTAVGIGDNSVSTEFRAWLGTAPLQYLYERRVETAARMLAATGLDERRVALAVGFTGYRSFSNHYKARFGKPPSEGRDRACPHADPSTLRRALRGELGRDEALRLLDELRLLYPDARPDSGNLVESAPVSRTVIDGTDYERYRADQLWQRIRPLPFENQKREVRGYLFRSTVLFDLLRKTSREEGREDRERGVRVAKLALVSLEGHEEVFGERIHDLRALGWAWLANARRLSFDAEGAEADMARAERQWSVPRAERDLAIAAEIRLFESGLRTWQRRYEEALELLDESIRLSRLIGNSLLQAQALVVRAGVGTYRDQFDVSIADLRSSLEIDHGDPHLSFIASLNLTNILAILGRGEEAARAVGAVTQLAGHLGRCARHQAEWVEALVKHCLSEREAAEALYLKASAGFAAIGDLPSFALISLDISIFYFEDHQRLRAATFARKALPVLRTWELGREALGALDLLATELEANRVTESLLRQIQLCLSKDPRVHLSVGAGSLRFRPQTRENR